jgi:hypothetical protein
MAEVNKGRWTARIDGDFVVFLIGARFDLLHPIRTYHDLGGRKGMKHMLDYLTSRPEKGLLGYEMGFPIMVQYWRSFEHLEAFARDDDDPHLEAWRNYWRRVGNRKASGIWHETYLVRAGEYETLYGNMRTFGLGKASTVVPVAEEGGARRRLHKLTTGS